MKKIASSLALVGLGMTSALSAFEMPALSLDSKIDFASEHVKRGRKEGKQNFKLSAETGGELLGGHVYAGAMSVLMLSDVIGTTADDTAWSMSANEVCPFVGYRHDVMGWFTADIGYVAHLHTNLKSYATAYAYPMARNTNEIFGGISADVICSPKLYLSYDIDREEFDVNGSASYVYDLSPFGLTGFDVEAKAEIGYDYAKRPFGIKGYYNDAARKDQKKDYFYYGVGADLVYKYSEQASIRLGAHYAGNSASKKNWNNAIFGGEHKDLIWFSSSVEFNF